MPRNEVTFLRKYRVQRYRFGYYNIHHNVLDNAFYKPNKLINHKRKQKKNRNMRN